MGANSIPRKVAKQVLAPLLNETTYRWIQGVAMAWDMRKGSWSEPEIDLLPLALRSGECMIDVGANYGLYSYHANKLLGSAGKIYAFEPVPFTASTFKFISKLLGFGNVDLQQKGCGDKPGQLKFTLPVQDNGAIAAGLAHISTRQNEREGKGKHFRFKETKEITCDVVRLDDVVPNDREISLIKCDTEGADLMVMKGASGIIDKFHPTIICEIGPWFMEGFGLKVEDLVDDFFRAKGYKVYRYADQTLTEVQTSEIVEDNWIFIHPSRLDRFVSFLPKETVN